MKKICLCVVVAMLFVMVFAGCDYSNANEATWEEYQEWLIDSFADKFSNPDSFETSVLSLNSWSDINVNSSPWSEIFGDNYYDASTWEEFSALGIGTYEDYTSGTGSMTAAAVTTTSTAPAGGSGEMGGTSAAAGGTAPGSTTTDTAAAGGTTAAAGGAGGASGQPGAAPAA